MTSREPALEEATPYIDEEIFNLIEGKEFFRKVSFKKGESLIEEGAPTNGCFYLISGKCKIVRLSPSGKDHISDFKAGGEIVGMDFMISDFSAFPYGATAIEDIEAYYLPKSEVMENFTENRVFSGKFQKKVSQDLEERYLVISDMGQKNVPDLIAGALISLQDKFGVDKQGNIDIKLTRQELAQYTRTVTENCIRILASLKKYGLIELKRRNIKILKKDTLRLVSEIGISFLKRRAEKVAN